MTRNDEWINSQSATTFVATGNRQMLGCFPWNKMCKRGRDTVARVPHAVHQTSRRNPADRLERQPLPFGWCMIGLGLVERTPVLDDSLQELCVACRELWQQESMDDLSQHRHGVTGKTNTVDCLHGELTESVVHNYRVPHLSFGSFGGIV